MNTTTRHKEILHHTLDVLEKHKIHITPLYNIKDGNNTKIQYGKSLDQYWKNHHKIPFNVVRQAINNGVIGLVIRIGKYNGQHGILTVDVDTKPTDAPELLQQLHEASTLTMKTPSGGFHFIFKYTEHIGIRTGLYGNIDILTNNKPMFNGIRSDGEYSVYQDNAIQEIPSNILIKLTEYQKPKEKFVKEHTEAQEVVDIVFK